MPAYVLMFVLRLRYRLIKHNSTIIYIYIIYIYVYIYYILIASPSCVGHICKHIHKVVTATRISEALQDSVSAPETTIVFSSLNEERGSRLTRSCTATCAFK